MPYSWNDGAPNEAWHNMTTIEDDYEIEMEMYSGRWRHRPLKLGVYRTKREFMEELGTGPWVAGRPPTGPHAKVSSNPHRQE